MTELERTKRAAGTYQRPKPRMVERSVKVTFRSAGTTDHKATANIAGKTGTFTWLEEEK